MCNSCPKAHLTSQCRQKFLYGGRGKTEQRDQGEGLGKLSVCRRAQSILSKLGFIILVLQLTVNNSLKAGMAEGRSLYFLKLVLRVLIKTCSLPTSCVLVRVSIYRKNVKRMVGRVTIPHCYIIAGLMMF